MSDYIRGDANEPGGTIHIPNTKTYAAVMEILDEAVKAFESNPPMNSLHEGYAVILEEMDELKGEVWKNPKKHPDRNALARKEAVQVAAMALRLIYDIL